MKEANPKPEPKEYTDAREERLALSLQARDEDLKKLNEKKQKGN